MHDSNDNLAVFRKQNNPWWWIQWMAHYSNCHKVCPTHRLESKLHIQFFLSDFWSILLPRVGLFLCWYPYNVLNNLLKIGSLTYLSLSRWNTLNNFVVSTWLCAPLAFIQGLLLHRHVLLGTTWNSNSSSSLLSSITRRRLCSCSSLAGIVFMIAAVAC